MHIKRPPYAESGVPPVVPSSIEIKTDEQIAAMRTACRTARKVLNVARDNVKVRIKFTTQLSQNGSKVFKSHTNLDIRLVNTPFKKHGRRQYYL